MPVLTSHAQVTTTIAQPSGRVDFNIRAQSLSSALVEYSQQSGRNIIGLADTFKGIESVTVLGEMSASEALKTLLLNTGLTYTLVGQRSVSIIKIKEVDRKRHLSANKKTLEEVVVTGTKRRADLQKTPIAISYIDSSNIALTRTQDLRDIAAVVPGLEFASTGSQESVLVQMRGVGTTNITEIADGPVSIHIDGIYSPRSQGVAALLHDVDRVEVLRGPQGTIFGRNSSSGSVNIYNRPASLSEDSLSLELGLGNYEQKALRLVGNLRTSDAWAFRFSLAKQEHAPYTKLLDNYLGLGVHYPEAPGDLAPFNSHQDLGQTGLNSEDRYSWRLSAFWLPSSNFDAQFSVERYQDNGTGNAELDPTLVDNGLRAVVLDTRPFVDLSNDVFRSKMNLHLSDSITATYQFGAARMSRQQLYDTDHGRTGDFEIERTIQSDFEFYSHELFFKNDDAARLKWVVGLFGSRESNSVVFAVDQQNPGGAHRLTPTQSWISGSPGAAVSYANQPERRAESSGVYSQLVYDLDSVSRVTVGTRYNRDVKADIGGRAINCRRPSSFGPYIDPLGLGSFAPSDAQIYKDPNVLEAIGEGRFYDGGTNIGIGGQSCWVRQVNDNRQSWSNTTGLLRYDVDINADTLLYGSVSTGFKAGHIQDAGNTAEPETVVSYELGAKLQLLDNSLRINTAIFQADYQGLQFSDDDRIDTNGDGIPDSGGSTVVRNASTAKVRGIELEMQWLLTQQDRIQAVVALIDAKFGRFDIPDSLFGNLFNPYSNEGDNSRADDVNLSGNTPPRVPDWKLSLAYHRRIELLSGFVDFSGVATISDEYFLDIFNRDSLPAGVFPTLPNGGSNLGVQSAYAQYDAKVGYQSRNERWSLEAYVKNLSDENVKIASADFITENGFTANYAPPRTYGLTFKIRY